MCVQIFTIEGWRVFNLSSRRAAVHLEASHASICNLSSRQTTHKDYFHQLAQILLSLIVWKEHKLYNWVNTPDNTDEKRRRNHKSCRNANLSCVSVPKETLGGRKKRALFVWGAFFKGFSKRSKKAAQTSVGSQMWRQTEPDASAFVYSFKIRPWIHIVLVFFFFFWQMLLNQKETVCLMRTNFSCGLIHIWCWRHRGISYIRLVCLMGFVANKKTSDQQLYPLKLH